MNKLTEFELSACQEIVSIGLSKASDSLSFFMNKKILVRNIEIKTRDMGRFINLKKLPSAKYFVLKTEVIGEMEGVCFLIFEEKDAKQIIRSALQIPEDQEPDPSKGMGMAFLMEIDNIVSASVITQFSNLLKFKIYGDVPQFFEVDREHVRKFISKHTNNARTEINFKASFISSGKSFNPLFIWKLDEQFVTGVRNYLTRTGTPELAS